MAHPSVEERVAAQELFARYLWSTGTADVETPVSCLRRRSVERPARRRSRAQHLACPRPDDPAYADAAANARNQLVVLDADREPPE